MMTEKTSLAFKKTWSFVQDERSRKDVIHRRSRSSARSTFPDARCISVSVSLEITPCKRETNAVESLKAFEQEYSLFTRSIPANFELPVYNGIITGSYPVPSHLCLPTLRLEGLSTQLGECTAGHQQ